MTTRSADSVKPCGHPEHPEDGNTGRVPQGRPPRIERGRDVEAHRNDAAWFVGKAVKLGFPAPEPTRKEWMWVRTEAVDIMTGELLGTLANTPLVAPWNHGDEVLFTVDEIVDVAE